MKPLLALIASVALTAIGASAQAGQTDKLFELETSATPSVLVPGESGRVQIKLRMKQGAHISAEAPIKVALSAKNLKLEKAKLSRTDAEHEADGPLFMIRVTGEAVGPASLQADLVFFVCTEKVCERQAKTVNIPVTVN